MCAFRERPPLDSGNGPVYQGWLLIGHDLSENRLLRWIMPGNRMAAVSTGLNSTFNAARPGGLGAAGLAWTVLALTFATLAGAWFFELAIGLKPCPLCLEQRYAYYVALPLAAVVAFGASRGAAPRTVALGFAVIALVMIANAAIGAFHSGVEWGFWPGPTDCSGPMIDLRAGSLLERLDKVKVVRCDEVQWRFIGLSLAGYNALISLGIAAVAVLGVRTARA